MLIAEGETATITVAITTKTLFQVDQTIDLAVTGTATSSDYNLLPSLTLPAGAKTATATLTAVSDSEDEEGNETVIVAATHAGQFIGSTTVTIRDEGRDTKDAGGAQALLALSASRWAEEMSDHRKLARRVEGAIGSNHGFVVVDTLKYLAKGGRIGKAQAFLGGMLQFKPIISIRDGEAHPVERPRTRRRAKDRIVELCAASPPYTSCTWATAPAVTTPWPFWTIWPISWSRIEYSSPGSVRYWALTSAPTASEWR